jgi:abortive infection bacteriophage resistance protein
MSVKKPYAKPPLSIDEQVQLLSERGLQMSDVPKIKYFLRNVNYYHLSIYFKFFQKEDAFIEETTFDDVLHIYKFDNKLRLLLLDVLERIEKSFKCRFAYELSIATNNSHFHLDERMYDSVDGFTKTRQLLEDEFEKSKEPCVLHYKEQYSEPKLPPIWIAVEMLSFGQCVKACRNMSRPHRNRVAHTFGGDDEKFVLNWMHCLSVLRNHCAHHSRLWNRDFAIKVRDNHRTYQNMFVPDSRRIFNYLVVMQIVLRSANPTSEWLDRLQELIDECDVDVKHMGFPEDWRARLDSIIND